MIGIIASKKYNVMIIPKAGETWVCKKTRMMVFILKVEIDALYTEIRQIIENDVGYVPAGLPISYQATYTINEKIVSESYHDNEWTEKFYQVFL